MSKANSQSLQAFLIHARPISETAFSITLVTLEQGKITCTYQGPLPEPGRLLQISIKRKLDDTCSAGSFRYLESLLIQSEHSAYFSLYLNELIYRLMPTEVPDESFFGCYAASLVQLNYPERTQKCLRFFEMNLLELMGMTIDFNYDQEHRAIDPSLTYDYVAGRGFCVQPNGRYPGGLLQSAGQLDDTVKGAMSVARECLSAQLKLVLEDKALMSREWPLNGKHEMRSEK